MKNRDKYHNHNEDSNQHNHPQKNDNQNQNFEADAAFDEAIKNSLAGHTILGEMDDWDAISEDLDRVEAQNQTVYHRKSQWLAAASLLVFIGYGLYVLESYMTPYANQMIENTIIVAEPSLAKNNFIDLNKSTDQSLLALVKKEQKEIVQKSDNQTITKNKKETLPKSLTQKTKPKTTSTKKNTSPAPSQSTSFEKKKQQKKTEKIVSNTRIKSSSESNSKNHILTKTSKTPVLNTQSAKIIAPSLTNVGGNTDKSAAKSELNKGLSPEKPKYYDSTKAVSKNKVSTPRDNSPVDAALLNFPPKTPVTATKKQRSLASNNSTQNPINNEATKTSNIAPIKQIAASKVAPNPQIEAIVKTAPKKELTPSTSKTAIAATPVLSTKKAASQKLTNSNSPTLKAQPISTLASSERSKSVALPQKIELSKATKELLQAPLEVEESIAENEHKRSKPRLDLSEDKTATPPPLRPYKVAKNDVKVGFHTTANVNFMGIKDTKSIGCTTGFSAEYRANKNWVVETGMYYARKQFEHQYSSVETLEAASHDQNSMAYKDATLVDLNIIEVPVLAKYQPKVRKRQKFQPYISAGVSAYISLQDQRIQHHSSSIRTTSSVHVRDPQNNDVSTDDLEGETAFVPIPSFEEPKTTSVFTNYHYDSREQDKVKIFPDIANLRAGFDYKLSDKLNLRLESQFKTSITKHSFGNLITDKKRFSTFGLQLGLTCSL